MCHLFLADKGARPVSTPPLSPKPTYTQEQSPLAPVRLPGRPAQRAARLSRCSLPDSASHRETWRYRIRSLQRPPSDRSRSTGKENGYVERVPQLRSPPRPCDGRPETPTAT